MTSTLLIVQFVLAILLVIIVLLQKVQAWVLELIVEAMIFIIWTKGPANFLTKATMALGLVFVINTLGLVIYIINKEIKVLLIQ